MQALVNRYGSRIISYPRRTQINDRVSREGMQDILIDLLLLSKNCTLIASYMSTYPEVAWWFGGCQATVEIIEPPIKVQEWRQRHSMAIYAKIGADIREIHRLVNTAQGCQP